MVSNLAFFQAKPQVLDICVMIIRERDMSANIQIRDRDGMYNSLVRKDHLKYSGVMTDDCVSWKYHISYISSRISRNIGIISKLIKTLSIYEATQANLLQPHLPLHIMGQHL